MKLYRSIIQCHAPGPGDPSRRELAEGSDGPGADEVKKEEVKKNGFND